MESRSGFASFFVQIRDRQGEWQRRRIVAATSPQHAAELAAGTKLAATGAASKTRARVSIVPFGSRPDISFYDLKK